MSDHPFDEVVAGAVKKIRDGFTIFQKFTCAGCGQRLTIDVPNKFFEEGTCDKCDAVTDIRKQGCNYMAMWTSPGAPPPKELVADVIKRRKN